MFNFGKCSTLNILRNKYFHSLVHNTHICLSLVAQIFLPWDVHNLTNSSYLHTLTWHSKEEEDSKTFPVRRRACRTTFISMQHLQAASGIQQKQHSNKLYSCFHIYRAVKNMFSPYRFVTFVLFWSNLDI